jgi:hypothetical protein
LAVKLPPTTLIALAAAPVAWARLPRPVRREAFWVIGLPALLLAAFTVQQQRPIGLRYFLPVLALWTVAAGAMLPALGTGLRRAVAGIAVVGAVGACAIVPSLAWTDPVLGEGYRVAADSNLDWGQGFLALRTWVPGHHPWVEYFGGAGFDRAHLAGARDLRQAPVALTGWVAVSASALTDYRRSELSWLRRYCPIQVLDRTILVYRFTRPPDRTGLAPAAPPRPCPGRFSRLRS